MAKPNLKNEQFFLSLVDDGFLRVTKSGRAFNTKTGREVAAETGRDVYRKISWQHPETKKIVQIQLHRLVWAVFKGIQENLDDVVNHVDGNKQNCRLSNLELTTVAGNNSHAQEHGLVVQKRGYERSNALFTDAEVKKYRKLYSLGRVTVKRIMDTHGASTSTVTLMLVGKTYDHLVTGFEGENAKLRESYALCDPETVEKIKRLRSRGLSSYKIAAKVGVSRNTVMKYW